MLQVSEVVSGNCKLKNRVQFRIRVGAILVEVNLIFFLHFLQWLCCKKIFCVEGKQAEKLQHYWFASSHKGT